ncbi:MFS transporter [Variovorax paradoxus]|jgi:predicted MFS family arabinose efflux permease|uniref:YbfB/YjiJ family MFS transporter n=3 Tax=Variovorax paradoxus TaxID=34073 RepID=UPI0006E6A33E|nr:MFS transporter [Variovorax paradoxus]KPV01700.1 MFS transporter [Variovorax paradoxus]KPV17814.1 MFS transporter [Variovorax paradoxus]KPV27700.1 MFS transporter [Variovorax paradoxus]
MSTTLTSSAPMPPTLRLAFALSMGAAVSLGITRFAYALLLPPMRDDLGWSYALAGGMNTANAVGYLVGALVTPALMRRFGVSRLLVVGAVLASLFMAGSGFVTAAPALLLQRLLAGIASAWVFVAGGLMAARLGEADASRGGLLLGIYYGGTGFGILASALLVPQVLQAAAGEPHGWAWAWWALAVASGVATVLLAWAGRALPDRPAPAPAAAAPGAPVALRRFGWALAGYGFFGIGYIGYMTFVIALLREQGASAGFVTLFYALLGIACIASSRLWAGLLDRYRGGQPQALLNGLLGVATLLPVLSASAPVALVSGLLFGGVFLSVVASTTALVRHNLPSSRWAQGISVFTIVFAFGQIVGPTITGWISDGPGGLARGLVGSAIALWLGAVLASRQHALEPA